MLRLVDPFRGSFFMALQSSHRHGALRSPPRHFARKSNRNSNDALGTRGPAVRTSPTGVATKALVKSGSWSHTLVASVPSRPRSAPSYKYVAKSISRPCSLHSFLPTKVWQLSPKNSPPRGKNSPLRARPQSAPSASSPSPKCCHSCAADLRSSSKLPRPRPSTAPSARSAADSPRSSQPLGLDVCRQLASPPPKSRMIKASPYWTPQLVQRKVHIREHRRHDRELCLRQLHGSGPDTEGQQRRANSSSKIQELLHMIRAEFTSLDLPKPSRNGRGRTPANLHSQSWNVQSKGLGKSWQTQEVQDYQLPDRSRPAEECGHEISTTFEYERGSSRTGSTQRSARSSPCASLDEGLRCEHAEPDCHVVPDDVHADFEQKVSTLMMPSPQHWAERDFQFQQDKQLGGRCAWSMDENERFNSPQNGARDSEELGEAPGLAAVSFWPHTRHGGRKNSSTMLDELLRSACARFENHDVDKTSHSCSAPGYQAPMRTQLPGRDDTMFRERQHALFLCPSSNKTSQCRRRSHSSYAPELVQGDHVDPDFNEISSLACSEAARKFQATAIEHNPCMASSISLSPEKELDTDSTLDKLSLLSQSCSTSPTRRKSSFSDNEMQADCRPDSTPNMDPDFNVSPWTNEDLRNAFRMFACTIDWEIYKSDLSNMLKALGETWVNEEQVMSIADEQTRYNSLDFEECLRFVNSYRAWQVSDLRHIFAASDRDNSGYMDAQELHRLLHQLQLPTTWQSTLNLVKTFDSDGNGVISLNEFEQFICHVRSSEGLTDDQTKEIIEVFGEVGGSKPQVSTELMVRILTRLGYRADHQQVLLLIKPGGQCDTCTASDVFRVVRDYQRLERESIRKLVRRYGIGAEARFFMVDNLGQVLQDLGYFASQACICEQVQELGVLECENSSSTQHALTVEEFAVFLRGYRRSMGLTRLQIAELREAWDYGRQKGELLPKHNLVGRASVLFTMGRAMRWLGRPSKLRVLRGLASGLDIDFDMFDFVEFMRVGSHLHDRDRKEWHHAFQSAVPGNDGMLLASRLPKALTVLLGHPPNKASLDKASEHYSTTVDAKNCTPQSETDSLNLQSFEVVCDEYMRAEAHQARGHAGYMRHDQQRFRKHFDNYDEDHSGFIERKETRKLLSHLFPKMCYSADHHHWASELIKQIDKDRNECFDFCEFLHIVRAYDETCDVAKLSEEQQVIDEMQLSHKEVNEFWDVFVRWAVPPGDELDFPAVQDMFCIDRVPVCGVSVRKLCAMFVENLPAGKKGLRFANFLRLSQRILECSQDGSGDAVGRRPSCAAASPFPGTRSRRSSTSRRQSGSRLSVSGQSCGIFRDLSNEPPEDCRYGAKQPNSCGMQQKMRRNSCQTRRKSQCTQGMSVLATSINSSLGKTSSQASSLSISAVSPSRRNSAPCIPMRPLPSLLGQAPLSLCGKVRRSSHAQDSDLQCKVALPHTSQRC